jgi:hypothetical protein
MENKIQPPIITATLAAGSTASPYYALVNITQRLCYKTCADTAPVFDPVFNVVSFSQIAAGQYVATINVHGCICYVRCGGQCGCTEQQPLNATFTIPFQSSSVPTAVSVSAGTTVNTMSASGCQTCSKLFVSETALTLTIS